MIRCEFTDRKGFKLLKVIDGDDAPFYYSFAYLPPYTTENWFGDGDRGEAMIKVDQLLFHLKRTRDGIAQYEEM